MPRSTSVSFRRPDIAQLPGTPAGRRRRPVSPAAAPPVLALLALVLLILPAGGCGPQDDSPRGLYRSQCARCHGLDGRGNPRAVKAQQGLDLRRSELLAAGDRPAVRRLLVEGQGTMPAFGEKLTPEQIDALVTLSFELAGLEAPPVLQPETQDREAQNPEE